MVCFYKNGERVCGEYFESNREVMRASPLTGKSKLPTRPKMAQGPQDTPYPISDSAPQKESAVPPWICRHAEMNFGTCERIGCSCFDRQRNLLLE